MENPFQFFQLRMVFQIFAITTEYVKIASV